MGYLGSKAASGAYQAIIALMPPHDTYIEPFAGSGAVLLHKPPALRSFAVDLDRRVIGGLPEHSGLTKVVGNAFEFIAKFDYAAAGRVLIYADPPYLHETRTSSKRYRFELSDEDHARLLGLLASVPASIVISGYPSALYERALLPPLWNSLEFQAMSRGGPRTEKLWFNFAPGAAHWSTFAGRNFHERQRIKRKATRWAAAFAKMPAAERQAVFAALLLAGHRCDA